jgi:hypothetical protein
MESMTNAPENRFRPVDVIDVSRSDDVGQTWWQMVLNWILAAGLVLLIPLVFLAIGVPLVLGVRALFEMAARLLAR